jgi:hypothetical protein
MLTDPDELASQPDTVEKIEKASIRLVTQALLDFRTDAEEIFSQAATFAKKSDEIRTVAEDITREALDRVGTSTIQARLPFPVDYKRARYVFNASYAVRQALFIDSKAEKSGSSIRLQTSQTSLVIKQVCRGQAVEVPGALPSVVNTNQGKCLSTTVFVKYIYSQPSADTLRLDKMLVVGLPNGMLQNTYNPSTADGIWNVGPNAPTLGEEFRTRISINKLRQKKAWRVQEIPRTETSFSWSE